MAFQIMDDVLDFSGEQATMGKPVGSDLLQGLVTLPAIYFAESFPDDPDVKLLAEGGWGNQERMDRLVSAIRNSDSIDKSVTEAKTYVERALEAIRKFPPSQGRAELENMAKYIIDRNI
jgi:geranylgeranyl pyrophosphate synthase